MFSGGGQIRALAGNLENMVYWREYYTLLGRGGCEIFTALCEEFTRLSACPEHTRWWHMGIRARYCCDGLHVCRNFVLVSVCVNFTSDSLYRVAAGVECAVAVTAKC